MYEEQIIFKVEIYIVSLDPYNCIEHTYLIAKKFLFPKFAQL